MTRFGGVTDVIGRQILIDGAPHSVVGVVGTDSELGAIADVDVWVPLASRPEAGSRLDREWRPVGRLTTTATISEVSAQVTAVAERLAREQPDTNRDWSARAATTRDALIAPDDRLIVTLLVTVVGLLLVLACANIKACAKRSGSQTGLADGRRSESRREGMVAIMPTQRA